MAYTWIPFYKELSKKLLQFRNDRMPLIDWIYDNLEGYIGHLKDATDGRRVSDIDPFTVFAIFNRGISQDKRIRICEKFRTFLNVSESAPKDFEGIPVMNTRQSNFMAFAKDREEGDIERLWNLFEDAVLDRSIEKSYDALANQYLIRFNITFALFWIRPDKYLPLDGHCQDKLFSLGITFDNTKFLPYAEYEKVIKALNEKISSGKYVFSNFAEFSHVAYTQKEGESHQDKSQDNIQISYWVYSPGEQAVFWDEYYQNGIMGLGWNKIGDLREYRKQQDLIAPLKQNYDSDTSQKNSADMLYSFAYEIKPGDIVFAKKGRSMIVGRGVVTSDYYYDANHEIQPHLRKVDWTDKGEWKSDSLLAMKTLTNITRYTDDVNKLNSLFRKNDKVKEPLEAPSPDVNYWWLTGSPKYWSPTKDWDLGEDIDYTLYNEDGNKRRIFKHFYEAKPGDIVIAYEATPVLQIVAIGKVMAETDGEVLYIRKVEELSTPIPYSEILTNAILKESEPAKNRCQGSLFRLTKVEYDEVMRLIRRDNPDPEKKKYEPYSDKDFLEEVYVNEQNLQALKNLLLRKKNLILQGAPGVGKTYAAKRLAYAIMGEKDESRVMQVQFHQNYSYEDFVMGYKPNESGGFKLTEGKFYKFCKTAAEHKDQKYFFIIDEINRGNLSKIFGELLMLIENDYRDKPIELSYRDEMFAVPSNVYIIGMMNTADRSLAMIDYALRRRFSFYEMKPGFEAPSFVKYLQEINDPKLMDLVSAIKKLNEVINHDDSLGSGFCIGHSYLCELGSDYDLESIVEYDIIPMLREYWFDNDERFNQEAEKLRYALQ